MKTEALILYPENLKKLSKKTKFNKVQLSDLDVSNYDLRKSELIIYTDFKQTKIMKSRFTTLN